MVNGCLSFLAGWLAAIHYVFIYHLFVHCASIYFVYVNQWYYGMAVVSWLMTYD